MKIYSKEEWAREQYKGRWEASPFNLDRVKSGELPAYYIGRRNVMVGGLHGCELLTEGVHFLVEDDYEELPWLNKENALEGACYRFPGGYTQVTQVYRLSDEDAREKGLVYVDRADFIQHAKLGEMPGGCALAGSDMRSDLK